MVREIPFEDAAVTPNATTHSAETKDPPKIALWGLFGQQNIGNECTLQALAFNVQRLLPDSQLFIVCTEPEDASERHGLPAIAMRAPTSAVQGNEPRSGNIIQKAFRVLLRRIPTEIRGWFNAYRALKGTDMLAMTGTGMLTDFGTSAFNYPYEILKWTLVARLRRCKVRFISVGVGPLRQPLSRRFIKWALSLADYRCYRDDVSRARLADHGFERDDDQIFPDLAFSLPDSLFMQSSRGKTKPTIGVGVMNYHGAFGVQQDAGETYSTYLDKTSDFIAWLVENDYSVRILHGDMRYDAQPRQDLRKRLEKRGFKYGDGQIEDDDVSSVSELIDQLADVNLVVSPRFHNLILAMMFGTPVISLSYDPKNDALLEGIGLGGYSQSIDELSVDRLIQQFNKILRNRRKLSNTLQHVLSDYRNSLEKQYQTILRDI